MALIVNGIRVAGVGLPGKDGAQGPKGDPGEAGADGAPGKSAYQAAVEKGYTGTEEEFNAALAGMQSAPFLPLGGGTMKGLLTLSGPPANENHAANKQYVDEHAGARVVSGEKLSSGAVTLPFTPTCAVVWSSKNVFKAAALVVQGQTIKVAGINGASEETIKLNGTSLSCSASEYNYAAFGGGE